VRSQPVAAMVEAKYDPAMAVPLKRPHDLARLGVDQQNLPASRAHSDPAAARVPFGHIESVGSGRFEQTNGACLQMNDFQLLDGHDGQPLLTWMPVQFLPIVVAERAHTRARETRETAQLPACGQVEYRHRAVGE